MGSLRLDNQFVLVVLDGWGVNPRWEGNAIAQADTPTYDSLSAGCPFTTLGASGEAVGLPPGQMGNSEVGHMNLGAGKVVLQEYLKISRAIANGAFFENETLCAAMRTARERGSHLHLFGLIGPGGVHSHATHLHALLQMAKREGLRDVFVDAFLDGRDTPPESAKGYLEELKAKLDEIGVGRISSVSGRYYAMDRDKRWDRVEKAYRMLTTGECNQAADPIQAVADSYAAGVTDEFVLPTTIVENGEPIALVQDDDVVVFFNFRGDRPRELTKAFVMDDFSGFVRDARPSNLYFVTLTEYEEGLPVKVAFLPDFVNLPLAKYFSDRGLRQFHTAETEKYAHVTFFFNGGREEPFPGEERKLVPSPKVATYDLKPEMSAYEVCDLVVDAINAQEHDFIIVNFANGDMVGHSGIMAAAIKAAEAVDRCLARIVAAAREKRSILMITADHGNADLMIDYALGEPYTAHSLDPVPLLLMDPRQEYKACVLETNGVLADVAPTILDLLGLPRPEEMTGRSLLRRG